MQGRHEPRSPLKPAGWSAHAGTITFEVPDYGTHAVDATSIDRPNTLCELVDVARKLTPAERSTLVALVQLIR